MPRAKKQATLFDLGTSSEQQSHTKNQSAVVKTEDDGPSVGCPVCLAAMDTLTMEDRIRHVEECLSMATIHETSTAVNGSARSMASRKSAEKRVKLAECSSTEVASSEAIEIAENPSSDETQKIVVNGKTKKRGTKTAGQKRKRELAAPQKEMLKYVNSEPTVKRKKEAPLKFAENGDGKTGDDGQNLELLPSSRKTEIPDLKIVKFPETESAYYCVSVDAFCYKPCEYIHQYFLSHFHSDHYGGITKRWCRERTIDSKIIYCSVITGRLLTIRYSVDPCHLFSMENDVRYKVHSFGEGLENGGRVSNDKSPGLYVTCIDANHCPGAVIFLFEGISTQGKSTFSLHCGDFRVNRNVMLHPLLGDFLVGAGNQLEKVYLDTTYMTPKYNFPKQEQVCESVATLIHEFSTNDGLVKEVFGGSLQSRITDFLSFGKTAKAKKYLVLVGTYLIGKEKLAVSISKRMGNAPIYVSNVNSRGDKEDIVRSYQDEYLDSVLTSDPVATSNRANHDVMIHLVPMKIAGNIQELHKYFNHNAYHSHFERCIGLRPTGWSFKDNGDTTEEVQEEIKSEVPSEAHTEEIVEIDETEMSLTSTAALLKKMPKYTHLDVLQQNGNKRNGKIDSSTYRIYSVPYSEHSSFRELSFFVVFFNINHVIPTVNTSNPYSASSMAEIIRRWETIRAVLVGGGKHLPAHVQSAIKGLSLDDF